MDLFISLAVFQKISVEKVCLQNREDMNGAVVMMQVCEIPKNCLSGEWIRYKNVRNWKQVPCYIHWGLSALLVIGSLFCFL